MKNKFVKFVAQNECAQNAVRYLLSKYWIIFILVFLMHFSFALSALGETCTFTGDCIEGFCEAGVCKEPPELIGYTTVGPCVATADCLEGYCKLGQCIKPTREEYKVMTFDVKRYACAGIIENCIGLWCAVCNVNWPLLFVGAICAGWVGRRRGRLAPIVLIATPIVIGLFVLPILGFFVALLELFILAVVKR